MHAREDSSTIQGPSPVGDLELERHWGQNPESGSDHL